MKPLEEFLSDLRQADVKVWTEQERLRYSAPEGGLTPDLLAQMKARKGEILTFLRQANTNPLGEIQPISRETPIPLSFAQQRLWFLDHLDTEQATYNISRILHLHGSLNVAALEQAFQALVARHETLRTSFHLKDDDPVQTIETGVSLTLPVIDFQHKSTLEQTCEVQRLAEAEARTRFDLTVAPLIRVKLLQLTDKSHTLLLTIHHIVADGWSMGLLFEELSSFYQIFCGQSTPSLPPLSIQYADFSQWQRQWLTGDVLQTQLDYWQTQLTDAPPLLTLPTDRPRQLVQTYRGSTALFQLSPKLTQQLTHLSQQSGTTLFITLLAAFSVLLSRYSNQDDIVIGSPIANRQHADLESLIGFFVNTLALRIQVDGDLTFSDLLAHVHRVALGAYAHQDLPFEKLVENLPLERSTSYSPIFQVMFVLQNVPEKHWDLPELSVNMEENRNQTSKFDLTLDMNQTAQGLVGTWEYNTDLFDADTIERLSTHFQLLLTALVTSPELPVTQLPLLTQPERQQLLVDWNQTQTDYPDTLCIHQLFEAQVERTPDAIALEFVDSLNPPKETTTTQQLTYRELNTRANQLAHHLQTLGVGPDVLVGLCVERSLDMVIALLGILKAGGAYLPLDPNYPRERLAFMLEDSLAAVLITTQPLIYQLPEHLPEKLSSPILLDTITALFEQASPETGKPDNCVSDVSPSNLAYVIYTSGSTGTPKGVMVTHQGLPNLAQAQVRAFGVQPDSRVLQFASFSFDASISEIVMTLCCGARLCLAPKDSLLPGPPLMELLQQQAISHVTLPPSALAMLPQEDYPHLKTLVVAGEPCPSALIEHWSKKHRFINAYGPTETTVCATLAHPVDSQHPLIIGSPLDNTHVYILDTHQHPVPVGVPGEIYIGGVGLAKGYLNRPKLTQERFIPNPFEDSPFKHLYKTGDLARYLSDGTIEFLGRLDHQVKVRGFRIEPGEIETVLEQHLTVHKATVVVMNNGSGNSRLVAYVVPRIDQTVVPHNLRDFLKQKLPDYMVPAAVVSLEAIPLTPNGKIDYHALPKPSQTESGVAETFIAPRIELERQLTEIWSNVLEINQIGIRDNFFDIGGNSLLAVQVVSQIEEICGYKMPVIDFFKAQTIERLGKMLLSPLMDLKNTWNLPWNPLEPVTSKTSSVKKQNKSPLFILNGGFNAFLAGAYWISRDLGKEQPCYSLHLRGMDGQETPQDRVEDMAAEAIAGIRTIQPEGPYLLLGLCFGGMVAYEMAQQLRNQGQVVTLLAIVESRAPRSQRQARKGFGKGSCQTAKIKMPQFDDKTESDPNLLRVMRGVHRAQVSYKADPYPGKLVVFQASEGTPKALQDSQKDVSVWRALADSVDVHQVAGDHESLYQEDNLAGLIDILRGYLELPVEAPIASH